MIAKNCTLAFFLLALFSSLGGRDAWASPCSQYASGSATEEYLRRLEHGFEKKLISKSDLQRVVDSPTPVNFFSDRSSAVLALSKSVDDLLPKTLEWSRIQDRAKSLLSKSEADTTKTAEDSKQTSPILAPKLVNVIPIKRSERYKFELIQFRGKPAILL